jgi:hypothetical protein
LKRDLLNINNDFLRNFKNYQITKLNIIKDQHDVMKEKEDINRIQRIMKHKARLSKQQLNNTINEKTKYRKFSLAGNLFLSPKLQDNTILPEKKSVLEEQVK